MVGVVILCRGELTQNWLEIPYVFLLIVLDIQLKIRNFTKKVLKFLFNMTLPKHYEHIVLDVWGHNINHVRIHGESLI